MKVFVTQREREKATMRWVKRTSIKQEVKRTSNKKKKKHKYISLAEATKPAIKTTATKKKKKKKKNSAKPLLQIKVEKSVKPKRACVQAPLLPSPLKKKQRKGVY